MTEPANKSFIAKTRRNHGLEHATINILTEHYPSLRLAGYSTPFGFTIVGPVTLEMLTPAIHEAIIRVSAGKRNLVIHERCGTNYVAGGVLAGLAAWLSLLGARRNTRAHLSRLPLTILFTTLALLSSPRLGTWLQRHITTSTQLQEVEMFRITQGYLGKVPRFTIYTRIN